MKSEAKQDEDFKNLLGFILNDAFKLVDGVVMKVTVVEAQKAAINEVKKVGITHPLSLQGYKNQTFLSKNATT